MRGNGAGFHDEDLADLWSEVLCVMEEIRVTNDMMSVG